MTQRDAGLAEQGPAPSIWLVRHARPRLPAGVCYGATDVPADAQQTAQIAAMLAGRLPMGAQLRSSPLQRCQVLARAVAAARPDLTLRLDARLVEMDFGLWEGWRWDDIPRSAFDAWTGQFAVHRFGGAESVQQLMDRVAQVWDELPACAAAPVWITHAGVMSAVTLLARGVRTIGRAEDWPAPAPAYGALLGVARPATADGVRGQD